MGWISFDSADKVVAAAASHEQVTVDTAVRYVEIPDDLLLDVLNGNMISLRALGDQLAATTAISDRPVDIPAYPALLLGGDMDVMIDIARQIAPNAVAVEIGSRLGGSAKLIAEHASSLTRFYCIDNSWLRSEELICHDSDLNNITAQFKIDPNQTPYAYAQELLRGFPMVRLLRFTSPYELSWWNEPVDFVFEDSSHSNPQLNDNLHFWWQHLRPGGLMCGHDYDILWPDVKYTVDAFLAQHGLEPQVRGKIWSVRKP